MSKQVSLDSKADKAVVDDLNVEVAATKMLGEPSGGTSIL